MAGVVKAYYDGGTVTLYLGDMREVLPALGVTADLIVADPPYGETSLAWDRWPDGWLAVAAQHANSLWCFGSMRMFGQHWIEYSAGGWKLSQDIIGRDETGAPVYGDVHMVWEKQNGSGPASDRFRRVHEHATHWYRGLWRDQHHDTPRVPFTGIDRSGKVKRKGGFVHTGAIGGHAYTTRDTRLMRSVLQVRNMNGAAIHPDEKPVDLLTPMIAYACPHGGLVVDPFAGSGSTLDAARQSGRRAIGIEGHEPYAERAARRLEQLTLEATP
jgi:site-specific DNA-methyltransferase (adenine-specific)